MTSNAASNIRRHIAAGRGVGVGDAVLFEMTRLPAIQTLASAIEEVGGQVISIDSETRPTGSTARTKRTVYTLLAILPSGDFSA